MGKPVPACYNDWVDILEQIDRAAGGLCPCGATPREGSAYCSEDCTPTHHGAHTVSHVDGTPMRWRPDLVTAADDSTLRRIGTRQRGRYTATLYDRLGGIAAHLRLDDGYRYVGRDLDIAVTRYYDGTTLWEHPAWETLERELTDRRRLDPDPWHASGDPWADVMLRQRAVNAVIAAMPAVVSAFRGISEAMGPVVNRLRELQPLIAPEQKPEPEHPLARMAARRRDVVHGPRSPQRPPRTLNVGRR